MKFGESLETLGTPTKSGENWAVYRGDCVELLAQMPAASVPLTVTSPPYNIGKSYEEVRDVGEYIDWCENWIELTHRITTSSGSLWLNLGYLSLPDRAKAIPIPYFFGTEYHFI